MDKNFTRLLHLLSILPAKSKPKVSTTQLRDRLMAGGFDVTPRTVQRDLEDLSTEYPDLECDARNKPYGWGWGKDHHQLSIPGMDVDQAISLRLMGSYLSELLPDVVSRKLRPLVDEADDQLRTKFGRAAVNRWSEKVAIVPSTQALIKPKISPSVHEIVTNALLDEKQLEITYTSPQREQVRSATVHPLGLVQQSVMQYLVMIFDGYTEPRYIPMHRIQKAKAMGKGLVAPKDFTLEKFISKGGFGYWSDFATLEPIQLIVRFDIRAVQHLLEAPLSNDQKVAEISKDEVRLSATVPLTERLVWWLMGFGANVVVEKPEVLRKNLAKRLFDAAQSYQN